MNPIAWLSLIAFATQAQAASICPPTRSQIGGTLEVTKYFFKTAIVGAPDRRTLKEFAKESGESAAEVAKRYAATGDIVCGDRMSQAQVVLKGDLILIAGHMLYDNLNCEKARDLKTCNVYFTEQGKRVAYGIEKEEAEGFTCPDSSSMKPRNDWAILRLKKPVGSSIKPYSIRAAPCASDDAPIDVIFVGKSNDYRRDPTKSLTEAPRHFGRCQIFKGNCAGSTNPLMLSDCDQDHGSSGGGLFTGDKETMLIGINSGLRNTCPESAADRTGRYRETCWSSTSVPIAGELKDRLERLAQP